MHIIILSFPYVCPEPVLLNISHLYSLKWLFVRRYLDNLKNDWASFYASEIATP
jgi:hypothetical protein